VRFAVLTPFGNKYRLEGRMLGPNGRRAAVVSIWIIRGGETIPRFVTAFPGSRR